MASQRELTRALMERHGTTYAERAGIRLKDKPSPLYRLLVLSLLLSARISGDIAVQAARELSRAGCRTPKAMAAASWQDRVDALGRGHYRRYDERTATMLGHGAELLLEEYAGDLRQLHDRADGRDDIEKLLQQFPGIGPTGAAIFCREAQAVWPDLFPYVDAKAREGAEALGLPSSPQQLSRLVERQNLPGLLAGCIDVATSRRAADEVKARPADRNRGRRVRTSLRPSGDLVADAIHQPRPRAQDLVERRRVRRRRMRTGGAIRLDLWIFSPRSRSASTVACQGSTGRRGVLRRVRPRLPDRRLAAGDPGTGRA